MKYKLNLILSSIIFICITNIVSAADILPIAQRIECPASINCAGIDCTWHSNDAGQWKLYNDGYSYNGTLYFAHAEYVTLPDNGAAQCIYAIDNRLAAMRLVSTIPRSSFTVLPSNSVFPGTSWSADGTVCYPSTYFDQSQCPFAVLPNDYTKKK